MVIMGSDDVASGQDQIKDLPNRTEIKGGAVALARFVAENLSKP
jgi:hypothetical protein